MTSAWPWIVIAGLGALHGANPAGGWVFAAVRGMRSGDRHSVTRSLWPIALGHVASIAVVAAVMAASMSRGWSFDLDALQLVAAALLVATALHCAIRRTTSLVAWSFLTATLQGTGLMLVPALAPLCIGEGAIREVTASGSLALALAAVALHLAAMLIVTAFLAGAVCKAKALLG